MATDKTDPNSTPAPDKRDDSTDAPVTQLAQVDANTSTADMKNMSGATDKTATTPQTDALQGLKDAKAAAKDPSNAATPSPFLSGPGSDIA